MYNCSLVRIGSANNLFGGSMPPLRTERTVIITGACMGFEGGYRVTVLSR
jgi:hypothetical protein